MQRRTNAGTGIETVKELDNRSKEIIPWKHGWPQVLPARPENIAEHGNQLGDHDITLKTLETVHIVEKEIEQRENAERIP